MTVISYKYGKDVMFLRCRLEQSSSPIETSVDSTNWGDTQYNSADVNNRKANLIKLGCTLMSNMLGGIDEDELEIKISANPRQITFYSNSHDSLTSEFVGNGLVHFNADGNVRIESNAQMPDEVYEDIERQIDEDQKFGESVHTSSKYFWDIR